MLRYSLKLTFPWHSDTDAKFSPLWLTHSKLLTRLSQNLIISQMKGINACWFKPHSGQSFQTFLKILIFVILVVNKETLRRLKSLYDFVRAKERSVSVKKFVVFFSAIIRSHKRFYFSEVLKDTYRRLPSYAWCHKHSTFGTSGTMTRVRADSEVTKWSFKFNYLKSTISIVNSWEQTQKVATILRFSFSNCKRK